MKGMTLGDLIKEALKISKDPWNLEVTSFCTCKKHLSVDSVCINGKTLQLNTIGALKDKK